jgi:hypothetical protein
MSQEFLLRGVTLPGGSGSSEQAGERQWLGAIAAEASAALCRYAYVTCIKTPSY